MKPDRKLHGVLALICGSAMPFAFAPYDYAWLAIPALTIWLWLIRKGAAWTVGFAFGFGWFGFGAWWVAPTLHTYGHLPWLVAALVVVLIGAVMAMLPALWAWLTWKTSKRSNWVLLAFPLAAVAEEWIRGHLFTGLPWTALGNLLLDTPAVGWAAWFGAYGMAALPALVAASLVLLISGRKNPWDPVWVNASRGLAGIALSILLFLLAPAPWQAEGDKQRAALIQGNIPQDQKWDAAFLNETMFRYAGLSSTAAAGSDVIIWPEAAIPFFLERAPDWSNWLNDQVGRWQTPLVYGGLKIVGEAGGKRTAQNGLFAHDPGSGDQPPELEFAGKRHLVPFGEYVPAWIPFLKALVPEIADFRPAVDSGIVHAGGHAYGALICYESLFPEEARSRVQNGAQVLVNVTNDAWYGTSPAAWQHLQAARMRAVETGRYLLRAANTGVTAIIGPDGSMQAIAEWWTIAAIAGDFRLSDAQTPFVRWGDLPLLSCLLLVMIPFFRGRERYG